MKNVYLIAICICVACSAGTDTIAPDGQDWSGRETVLDDSVNRGDVHITVPDVTDVKVDGGIDFFSKDTGKDMAGQEMPWVPDPGEAGYPCDSDGQCNSGFCIQTPDGKQCTLLCSGECPFGWKCELHGPSQPDDVYICVPAATGICRPCVINKDCWANDVDAGLKCVSYGPAGDFCSISCAVAEDCPAGYDCLETETADGALGQFCTAKPECQCTQWFSDEGAFTSCHVENEHGLCEGERQCLASGLTDCSAQIPAAEVCNGADDDCDGGVDEGTEGGECFVSNSHGNCPGVYLCINGQLACEGEQAKAEICDGDDNDCDGMTDEGFPDTDDDGLADCLETDKDGDLVPDGLDNCVSFYNPGQQDFDLDMLGDACDPDDDNDLTADTQDCAPLDPASHPGATEVCDGKDNNCNLIVDEGFADSDADGWKDCVDEDDDNDGVNDNLDCQPLDAAIHPGAPEICDGKDNNCDFAIDPGFPNLDGDDAADCVDDDLDGDGVDNELDNCAKVANGPQADLDGDGAGDACDPDADGDSIPNALDNCQGLFNPSQVDSDGDGAGDACDDDLDGDGVPDDEDNCPKVANAGQADLNDNGIGDACEDDLDGDGVPNGQDCKPLDAEVFPGAAELCDGADNDCDYQVDEGYPDFDKDGVKDCIDPDDDDDGDADDLDCAPFNPNVGPSRVEVCDGVDNNCNDKSDEGFGVTTCGQGECKHTIDNCSEGLMQICNPFDGVQGESCDGKDNDCDGGVDEDLGVLECGMGQCNHLVPVCVAGQANECDPMQGASQEVCDGKDNDCDGPVDEELGTTTCGLGNCEHTVDNCVGGVPQMCNPFVGAAVEVCDNADNDCDGIADDNLGVVTCGLGACLHTVANCVDGQTQQCDPMDGAVPEKCDGLDNDCDGQVDEELGKETCGIGACQHTVDKCVGGVPQVCNPFLGATGELCDGKDNDCDGQQDEDLGSTTCGMGECLHTVDNCVDSVPQICNAFEGAEGETCDGKDNDCDGLVDEELGSETCGKGECEHTISVCQGGEVVLCDPMEGAEDEVCDDKDNDCDGVTDPEGALQCVNHYVDGDNDQYGAGQPKCLCAPEGSYKVTSGGDCADDDQTVYPAPHAICGKDADCDGALKDPGEECDDGNAQTGDGCDGNCKLEPGIILTGKANNSQFGYEGNPPYTIGTIPGKAGLKVVIEKVGICGDADEDSGPKRFRATGSGLDVSWHAGQNQGCAANYWLGYAPHTSNPQATKFVYADVNKSAAVGAAVTVAIDCNNDWDGNYCQDTDIKGNTYDDSSDSVSVRGWVLYHYE